MAIHVVLDLTEAVSVQDLWRFLAFVPHWYDEGKDIRATDVRGLATRYLEIELSVPEGDARQP